MNTRVHITCCPGCGRPVPRDDLDLPRIKRRIYDAVSRHPGISAEHLRRLIWADDPNGGPENFKLIHVHVHQLNRRLRPYGIEVRGSVSGGYHLRFHQQEKRK
jgi:hypothetical protein